MRIKRNFSSLFLILWVHCVLSEKGNQDLLAHHKIGHVEYDSGYGGAKEYGHHEAGHGGGGYDVHEGGYGHDLHASGGGYGGHNHVDYKPQKCHPQTITKYKTVYKERKAQVVNQVEVLNPRPHVKKITETRYTTIRYPVFITQVIKPLLTQIETKVKPVFFTKTVDKYTTVLFTVTGIGQVTVTTVKYEKEYITRCMKKGYYHRSFSEHEGPEVKEGGDIILPLDVTNVVEAKASKIIPPSPLIPPIIPPTNPEIIYNKGPIPEGQVEEGLKILSKMPIPNDGPPLPPLAPPRVRKRRPNRKAAPFLQPPRGPGSLLMRPPRRGINRSGMPAEEVNFQGEIGDVQDLYSGDIYYNINDPTNREGKELETSYILEIKDLDSAIRTPHPPLSEMPLLILE